MIVFVHGLNTYGDDLLHVGPLTFGMMHSRLEKAFQRRDIDFVGVTKLGAGSPEEQAERALNFLENAGLLGNDLPLTLVGQSTGGLVARVLAARPTLIDRIRAVFTLGTPHLGTKAANFGLEFAERYPGVHNLFSTFGYNTKAKAEIFRHYTPEAMVEFNSRYPGSEAVPEYSLICNVKGAEISLPLRVFHKRIHEQTSQGWNESDGFVSVESQTRGQALGPFALDHFGELGAFYQSSTRARREAAREFERMIDTIARYSVNTRESRTAKSLEISE